jgi:subtilisin family serine protease
VVAVGPNSHRRLFVDPTDEEAWPWQWGHHNVGQLIDDQWNPPTFGKNDVDLDGLEALAVTGGSADVVVAVIDDGVDFGHPELADRAWTNPGESGPDGLGGDKATNGTDDDLNGYVDDVHGWDFCNDDNSVHDFDEDWHGTGVAGTIAASIDGTGTAGIAPGTSIMALKFLKNPEDDDPVLPECGWDDQAVEAIEYAKSFGVRIINASWGGDDGNPALEAAIEASCALFVAASGNSGRDIDVNPAYPAAFDSANIVSVGSINNDGAMSSFSNFGDVSVDVVAPGRSVLGPCPADAQFPDPGTCWLDGTSFAAPYVSGVAALVGAVNPTLLNVPTGLRSRLLATGTSLPSAIGKTATGRLLNARRAIDFTAPVASGGVSVLPLPGSVLGTSSVRTRLSWPAASDDLAMGSYRLEQRRNGGAWTLITSSTTARTRDVVIALSGTYEFRVTPRDAVGNAGTPLMSRIVTPVRYEESSGLVKYAGTWGTASSTAFSGGRTRYTTASGASATFTFNGRTGAVIAPTGPTRSSFKVYVDGVLVKTVSLYSSTTKNRVVVYTTGTMAYRTHTIKLVHTRVGSRIRGEVDAFVVLR